jgi:membrane protease YdiL (CAAX protease family)
VVIFLLLAFGIAWAFGLWVYFTGGLFNSPELIPNSGITLAVAILALGYMWAPAIAHLLTRVITKEGWKNTNLRFDFGKHWWTLATAWFFPVVLVTIGTALYFLVFPDQFDPNLSAVQQMLQTAESQTGQSLPIDLPILILIQLGVSVLIAPIINSFFTFGEEFGWRGYLQPKLMPLGYRNALVLTGVIWSVWHWPVIAMGHNFGLGYWGAPWTGFLMMTWFTVGASIIIGWLVYRAQSVWPAVIAHAAMNGIAGAALLFLAVDAQPLSLLGPAAVGLIANIPWALFAAYLLWKGEKA